MSNCSVRSLRTFSNDSVKIFQKFKKSLSYGISDKELILANFDRVVWESAKRSNATILPEEHLWPLIHSCKVSMSDLFWLSQTPLTYGTHQIFHDLCEKVDFQNKSSKPQCLTLSYIWECSNMSYLPHKPLFHNPVARIRDIECDICDFNSKSWFFKSWKSWFLSQHRCYCSS